MFDQISIAKSLSFVKKHIDSVDFSPDLNPFWHQTQGHPVRDDLSALELSKVREGGVTPSGELLQVGLPCD